nr:DUF2325 domain-containing protein [uncultured Rhodopila sp.]
MSGAGLSIAIKTGASNPMVPRPMDFRPVPATILIKREAAPRRTKIWEFSTNLHCSIVGTCLSTTELRSVLKKFGMAADGCSDHDLHAVAVSLASRRDEAARQLNKVLDQRHKLAVSQFAKADTEQAVRAQWRESVKRGEIPGAYWATLTHPVTTQALVREAFGEVHMLSHLVGSANRADIKRLCALASEKAALEAKVQRQQQALHEAVVARDTQIQELRHALTQKIVASPSEPVAEDSAALRDLVADLERRLSTHARRRAAMEERLAAAQATAEREAAARATAEKDRDAMRHELSVIEAILAPPSEASGARPEVRLDGVALLYVGGRPNQFAPMRAAAERLGATLLHHDGGIENQSALLHGLASRADVVLFPVDCISHEAVNTVKALCRQSGKRYIPLRSASITSLLTALQAPEIAALSAAV